jgi:ferrous iron transport protein A
MRLDDLPLRAIALVTDIDWDSLSADDAQRLKDVGIEAGVMVEATHYAPFARDPIACTIGAETHAVRRAHAAAVTVERLTR